jgi:hypothetical protein
MSTTANHSLGSPHTRLGWWSLGLEIAFALMFIANIPFNIYVIQPRVSPHPVYYVILILFMLLCGTAGALLGLIAITRYHDRSPFVWISTLIGIFAVCILLNELVQGAQYMLAF